MARGCVRVCDYDGDGDGDDGDDDGDGDGDGEDGEGEDDGEERMICWGHGRKGQLTLLWPADATPFPALPCRSAPPPRPPCPPSAPSLRSPTPLQVLNPRASLLSNYKVLVLLKDLEADYLAKAKTAPRIKK